MSAVMTPRLATLHMVTPLPTLHLLVSLCAPTPGTLDSWELWNRVRCMCSHNGQLGVALELGSSVPAQSEIQRWFGEPVRAIVVPVSVFQTNKRGFPALSKAHQAVLVSFFQLNVQVW